MKTEGEETKKPLRVIGYIRVSSEEQKKGQSPEAQREFLQGWSLSRGWTLQGVVDDDVGEPAEFMEDLGRRKGLQKILELKTGEVDAVIAWHNDRLSRDVEQLLYIDRKLRSKNIKLIFSNMENVDLNTPTGHAMLQMAGVFAELEKRTIGLRVKLGKNRSKKQGRRQGQPLTGFRIDKDTGQYVPDEIRTLDELKQRAKQLEAKQDRSKVVWVTDTRFELRKGPRCKVYEVNLLQQFKELQDSGINPLNISRELDLPQAVCYRIADYLNKHPELTFQ